MPYLPGTTPPPEEQYPPPQDATAPPPPESTPAPAATEEAAAYGDATPAAPPPQQAAPPATEEDAAYGQAAPATEEAATYDQGPFTQAVKGAQEAVGNAVAPIAAQLPEPVRNLADIVGQPVGGAIDTVTNVTGHLGQGDLPGAALAGLAPAMAPQARGREQVGERVAQGKSASPQNEVSGDPGAALAILPSLVLNTGLAAGGGPSIDDWARANPQAVQDAYAAGGGNAVVDAYLASINANPTPPPQLSNPLDAGAVDANPLQRAANIAGAVPEFLGGYAESAREGTLTPFLRDQLIEAAIDPLSFLPPAWGEKAAGSLGRAAEAGLRRTPGVGRLLELTPEEAARLAAEQTQTAGGEYVAARGAQRDFPPEAAPAAGSTPGPVSPPPPDNGPRPTPADLGQAAPAAPPPAPPRRVVPRDANGQPPFAYEQGRPIFRDEFLARHGTAPRTAAPEPRPPSERVVPPVRATPRQEPPVRVAGERPAPRREPELHAPLTGAPIGEAPTPPVRPPSRGALGLRASKWVDASGTRLVETVGTGKRSVTRVRPDFAPTLRRVYDEMKDAPPEQFWEPFPATMRDADVPVGDVGIFARYRALMTQGHWMFDDWGTTHALRRLPPEVVSPSGRIDWSAVERLANGEGRDAAAARKALAGQRASELYTHRILTSPDQDVEVRHLLTAFHVDQVSARFDRPQYRDTSYWADRAEMIGEAMRDGGYTPSPAFLAEMRATSLADLVREAYAAVGEAVPEGRLAHLEGKSLFAATPDGGATLIAHLPPSPNARFARQAVDLSAVGENVVRASEAITPETRPALEAALRQRLDQYGLTDVALRLVDRISDVIADADERARGVYQGFERIITLALHEADELPLSQAERVGTVLDHEVVHALRGLDLFTAHEWDTLVRTAREQNIGQMVSNDYAALERWNPAMAREELVAHLYEAWRIGKVTVGRQASTIMEKVLAFFRGIGQALRDTYPEEILRSIENGEIGRRPRGGVPGTADDLARYRLGNDFDALSPDEAAALRRRFGKADELDFEQPLPDDIDDLAYVRATLAQPELRQLLAGIERAVRANPRGIDNAALMRMTEPFVTAARATIHPDLRDIPWVVAQARGYALDTLERTRTELTGLEAGEFTALDQLKADRPSEFYALRLRRQQAVDAAYGATAPEVRQAVREVEDRNLTRYGIVTSEQAAKQLAERADGMFHFPDGWRPAGLTQEDVLNQTIHDVEFWANVEEMGNWTDTASATRNREWQQLERRFNPDGTVDRQALRGPTTDLARQAARDEFALKVFNDALDRALPKSAPTTRLGKINAAYLGFMRRNQLFNVLNIPRYTLQNMITNTVNMGARVGAKGVIDLWTDPAEFGRVFRYNKALSKRETFHTTWGSLERQMGVGHKPNIPQSHVPYLDRTAGKLPRALAGLSKVVTPDTARWIGTTADQLFRESAATTVAQRGYRALNRDLVPRIRKELYDRGVAVPEAKIRQVTRDFLDSHRTLTDANTGLPYRTVSGRAAKFEPVWNPDELGAYLRKRLPEDMRDAPDPGALNRAVDRVVRNAKNDVRGILDEAEATVDHAFFDFRDTNADRLAGKVFLFHYWQTRQGGFYVQEALKRPAVLAAYGRMMTEMQQQAGELDQPKWMTGFFQFQNSVAGFSTWFSPFDLLQSLLTFADWQMGEDASPFKDVTNLGKVLGQSPFLIHPLLQLGAYELGLLGPDYYAPPVTGLETFGARAIDLLNFANAHDQLPSWVNAMGIGVDANGNKVPLPVRPLQELYARVGNAISTAMEPITGLSPVEVTNALGSQQRNIASVMEMQTRQAHPDWDQMRVDRFVTDALADPGSDAYQAAFRAASEMPYQATTQLGPIPIPGILQGLGRIASPIPVYNWPEQYNLDRWNLTDSGATPPRNIPGLGDPNASEAEASQASFILNEAKYGATSTVEGRRLAQAQNDYYQIMDPALQAANSLAGSLGGVPYGNGPTDPVTVGGVEYTPEMLAGLSKTALYDLGTQALADAGYTREDVQASKDAQARYLADHPDLAGYFAYKDLIEQTGEQAFVEQTAAENPGFAQFVRSSMTDHTTGVIDYHKATYPDAYLASQGVRPSVYSPVVGNEPSRVPGGYPALAGGPTDQPLLPQATAAQDLPLYSKPTDTGSYYADENQVATIGAGAPLQVLSLPDDRYGMARVAFGEWVGYVDARLLNNASPPPPNAPMGPAPAPIQPTGGLAGLAGSALGELGGAKDAIGNALGGIVQNGPQPDPKTPAPVPAEGPVAVEDTKYGLSPWARDGAPAELVHAVVPSASQVGWDFRDNVGADWYGNYFTPATGGHGDEHPGIDIWGTEGVSDVLTPVGGTVVCTHSDSGEAGVNGFGCGAFYDDHGGAGKIEVQIAPNQSLIFGHMQSADVAYGQQVSAETILGKMGWSNEPHVHLEARLWNPDGTYTIVDPTLMLAGYYG